MPTLPDSDPLIREWLRSFSDLMSMTTPERIYFAMPKSERPTLPLIVMSQVSYRPAHDGQVEVDYRLDCWGENKHDANKLGILVAQIINNSQYERPKTLTDGYVYSGRVNHLLERPGISWARRNEVDATFTIRA